MARSLRLTEEQLRALDQRLSQASPTPLYKTPKYRNKPTVYNGRRYSSKLEADYARQLDLEWQAGTVLWYTTQVPFVLEGGVTYRADFLVVRPGPYGGVTVQVVDSTGIMTQVKYNKLRQVESRYRITVLVQTPHGLVPYTEHKTPRASPRLPPGG